MILTLLDPNIKKYVLRWKGMTGWVGSKEVKDENGNTIGSLVATTDFRSRQLLLENDGSLLLTCEKRFLRWTPTFDIKDSKGNLLGVAKKKKFSFKAKMSMRDKNGKIILNFLGPLMMGGTCQITDGDEKNIAVLLMGFDKGRWRAYLGLSNHNAVLDILDLTFDRKILLGFFVAAYTRYFDIDRETG